MKNINTALKRKMLYVFLTFLGTSMNTFAQQTLPVWSKTVSGTNSDLPNFVTTDSNENVISAGSFNSSFTIDGTSLSNNGSVDFYIVKYDFAGNKMWAKSFGGSGLDSVRAITADALDNVYVVGSFASSTITFGGTTLSKSGNSDLFILKLDKDGTVVWVKSGTTGAGEEVATAVKTDSNGNVVVGGTYLGANLVFDEVTLDNVINNLNLFLVKLSSAGDLIWAKNSTNDTEAFAKNTLNSLAIDKYDNIYATGSFASRVLKFQTETLTNQGNFDLYLAKFNTDGTLVWAKSGSGAGDDLGNAVTSNSDGNVYVVGSSSSTVLTIGGKSVGKLGVGINNMFLAKIGADGNATWLKNEALDSATAIAIDQNKKIWVAGNSYYENGTFQIYINQYEDVLGSKIGGNFDYRNVNYNYNNRIYNLNDAAILNSDHYINAITTDHVGNVILSGIGNGTKVCKNTTYLCADALVSDLDSNFIWYAEATGGTALEGSIALTNNTVYYAERNPNTNGASRLPFKTVLDPKATIYVDADNDGLGSIESAVMCVKDNIPNGYSANNLDCNDNNALDRTEAASYYKDNDQDGYGDAAVSVRICSGDNIPSGYILIDNSYYFDCNDANPAIHPGVAEILDDIDSDCNGYVDDAKILTNEITSSSSAITCDNMGVSKYRFEVRNSSGNTATIITTTNSFKLSQFYGTFAFKKEDFYDVRVALFVNNAWKPYGPSVNVNTSLIPVTQLTTDNRRITTNTDPIRFDRRAEAQMYKIRINTGTKNIYHETTSSETANCNFTLASLTESIPGSSFKVAIAVKFDGKYLAFGPNRNVLKPGVNSVQPSSSPVPTPTITTTKVATLQCGVTIGFLNTKIYANTVTGATGYTFEVTNGGVTETIVSGVNYFTLTQLTGMTIRYETTYSIRVKPTLVGLTGTFGTACNVTTPTLGLLQCGATIPTANSLVYSNSVEASAYRYEITSGGITKVVTNTARVFKLAQFGGVLIGGTVFSVRVSAKMNDVWSDYGPACSITLSPTEATRFYSEELVNKESIEILEAFEAFEVKTYPNPFSENFSFAVKSGSDEDIIISVYDMIGKRIETKNVSKGEINNYSLGNNYTAGIYNVIVSQGVIVKTLRIIKK